VLINNHNKGINEVLQEDQAGVAITANARHNLG